MALGLPFVIVAFVINVMGYFFSPPGSTPAQAVDSTTSLLLMMMIVASLNEFHYGDRWKANACRR